MSKRHRARIRATVISRKGLLALIMVLDQNEADMILVQTKRHQHQLEIDRADRDWVHE